VLSAWIVAAASIVLITAALTAAAKPSLSFSGSSADRGYGLFVQLRCGDGCASGAGVAVIDVTAGRPPTVPGPCPYGTDALPSVPIVDGRFSSGQWLWIARRAFVWLWVSGRLVSRRRRPGPCGVRRAARLTATCCGRRRAPARVRRR
jgi:hypothetical protein